MHRIVRIVVIAVSLSCGWATSSTPPPEAADCATIPWPKSLPVYDHVVIVVEENKDYEEIIDSHHAPYINGTLKAEGANFTRAFGEEHPSQGNYFWLFSGSNQGIGFVDQTPNRDNNPNYPFTAANLGQQLIDKGLSFKGYAESLPAIGDTVVAAGIDSSCGGGDRNEYLIYARKHVPWASFANVPNGTTAATSSNLRFADFPSDYTQLPTVAFVIPNLHNDMHNCAISESVRTGDTWLRDNLDRYYQWAKGHNSLLILTFDENNDTGGYVGLTNPAHKSDRNQENRIATIFAGAHIKQGEYAEGKGITHVNMLRTLEAMYGLCRAGAQQPHALRYGITDDYIVTDVFDAAP